MTCEPYRVFCGPLTLQMALLGCDDLARWALTGLDEEDAVDVVAQFQVAITNEEIAALHARVSGGFKLRKPGFSSRLRDAEEPPRRSRRKRKKTTQDVFLDRKREPWRKGRR